MNPDQHQRPPPARAASTTRDR